MSFTNTKPYTLLFIGRPVAGKGLTDLVRALDTLRDYNWTLTIIGDIIHDDDLFTGIKPFLPHQLSFLGPVPNAEICSLLNRHDIVVVPSRYENFGQVALEAMACSKAIIASGTGGLKELIINGYNGLHFAPGNHLDLSMQIKILFDNPSLMAELGEHAATRAKEYSWVRIIEKTLRLLESLAG